MSCIAVLGEWTRIKGYALAGARTISAEDADAVRTAWSSISEDVAVVIATPRAAAALESEDAGTRTGRRPLLVVMPI